MVLVQLPSHVNEMFKLADKNRVPTGLRKRKSQVIFVFRERSWKNIIFEKSGKMIMDHADSRYL